MSKQLNVLIGYDDLAKLLDLKFWGGETTRDLVRRLINEEHERMSARMMRVPTLMGREKA